VKLTVTVITTGTAWLLRSAGVKRHCWTASKAA
jgi:hypothetical protein